MYMKLNVFQIIIYEKNYQYVRAIISMLFRKFFITHKIDLINVFKFCRVLCSFDF